MISSRAADWTTIGSVAAVGVAVRLIGLDRSLSLDEAWVANSVIAGTLSETLFYEAWLQTSPPLFLILERSAVSLLGLSEAALRSVPLLAGLASVVVMYLLSRSVLSGRWVLLAWAMIALSPPAIEYSRTVKQYSLELTAALVASWAGLRYMEAPTRTRFFQLLAAATIGLAGAYSLAFVVPGLALAVLLAGRGRGAAPRMTSREAFRSGLPRGLMLCAACGAVLLWLHTSFVRPNSTAALREFWFDDRLSLADHLSRGAYGLISQLPIPDDLLRFPGPVGVLTGSLLGAGLWLSIRRHREGRSEDLQLLLVCGAPIVAAVIAHGFAVYPVSARTSLFLLPGTALVVTLSAAMLADALTRAGAYRKIDGALAVALLVVPWLIAAMWAVRPLQSLRTPVEDFSAAVAYLQDHARTTDAIVVHASAIEGFTLYARLRGWTPPSVRHGATGWPCCPRGVNAVRGSSTAESARQDLDRVLPPAFAGRVWLLYTTRPGHWRFAGVDEPAVQRAALAARGCRAGDTPPFTNVGVSVFDCGPMPAR